MPLSDAERHDEEFSASDAAMENLVVRLHKPLYRYFARRTRLREDAEDLTQEVFVRLSRRRDLQDVGNLESFVFSVAANLLTDFYRRGAERSALRSMTEEDLDIAALDPDPCRIAEDRQDLNGLLAAIKALPPRRRDVFIMHRFETMSYAEISCALGISVSAVEKHVAAAVTQLVAQTTGPLNV